MNRVWEGTVLEHVANEIWHKPECRLAYFLGQIDYTLHDIFGVQPGDANVPQAAREIAGLMITSLTGARDPQIAIEEAAKIIAEWRKGAN